MHWTAWGRRALGALWYGKELHPINHLERGCKPGCAAPPPTSYISCESGKHLTDPLPSVTLKMGLKMSQCLFVQVNHLCIISMMHILSICVYTICSLVHLSSVNLASPCLPSLSFQLQSLLSGCMLRAVIQCVYLVYL